MRPSQVPVRPMDRHGLLFDPGGFSRGSPITPRQMLRSGTLKPSAFAKVTPSILTYPQGISGLPTPRPDGV